MRRRLQGLLFLIFFAVLGLDQLTKEHVQRTLLLWEEPANSALYRGNRVDVLTLGERPSTAQEPEKNYFGMHWQYSRNKGAAFSMLAGMPDTYRVPFFFLITLIAVVMILYYLRVTPIAQPLARFGLALILAGAIGNFLDRVHRGYVVDFIATEWNLFGWSHEFAIFNVADVAINVGVAFLLLDMLLTPRRTAPRHPAP